MKISQLTTNETADAFIILAPEIEILMNDQELIAIFQNREKSGEAGEAKKLGMKFMFSAAVYLLKNQRETTFNILGALSGIGVDDIGKQLFPKTLGQIIDILNDPELMSFFTSFAPSEQEQPSD